jgi:hypothetical protein
MFLGKIPFKSFFGYLRKNKYILVLVIAIAVSVLLTITSYKIKINSSGHEYAWARMESIFERISISFFTMLITAIIFDKIKTKLAQQQKEQEELPRKKALYREIKRFYGLLEYFFYPPLGATIPHNNLAATKNCPLFSFERLYALETSIDWSKEDINAFWIQKKIRTNSYVTNYLAIEWYDTMINNIRDIGEKMLDRFYINLSPELFGNIHAIIFDKAWDGVNWVMEPHRSFTKIKGDYIRIRPSKDMRPFTHISNSNDWSIVCENTQVLGKWLEENKNLAGQPENQRIRW